MASRWERDQITRVPLQRPILMIPGKHYHEPVTDCEDVYRNDLVVGTFYD